MDSKRLAEFGRARFGDKWIAPLADELGMVYRSLWGIAHQDLPIAPTVVAKLLVLSHEWADTAQNWNKVMADEHFRNPLTQPQSERVGMWAAMRSLPEEEAAPYAVLQDDLAPQITPTRLPSQAAPLQDDLAPEVVSTQLRPMTHQQAPVGHESPLRSIEDWRIAFAAMSAAELLAHEQDAATMATDVWGAYEGEKDRREERGEIGYDDIEQKYYVVAAKKRLD